MKVQELQIGDLVDYRGKVIKVTSLYAKGGSNEVGFGNREDCWVNGDVVTPIPLANDILYKNGFDYHHKNYASLEYPKEDTLMLEHVCYNREEVWRVNGTFCYVRYVHELQHVLRAYKIDKEITI